MKLCCKDCGYLLTQNDVPTSTCPKCGSIYLVPVNLDTVALENNRKAKLKDEKQWLYYKIVGVIVLLLVSAWVINAYIECQESGMSCRGFAKVAFGIISFLGKAL